MNFLSAILNFLVGILIGIVQVGFFSALPFPYSEFPLIPILVSLALVLRVRPTIYWVYLTAIVITDLYRAAGFGVGILSFVVLIFVMNKITSSLFSHRSLIGCLVISAMTGAVWTANLFALGHAAFWLSGKPSQASALNLFASMGIQSAATLVIVGLLFALIPQWWRSHSPMMISGRL